MKEQPIRSHRWRNRPNRIQLSLLLGIGLIIVLGCLANFFPLHIAKYLFWPALLFMRVYGDDGVTATYYYPVAIPLAILVYSLIIYVFLALKGWPKKENGIEAKKH